MKVFIFLFFIPVFCFSQTWKTVKNEQGIRIEKNTETKANTYNFRTTVNLKTSVEELLKRIENVSEYPKWLYKYNSAEIIEELPNGFVFRAIIKSPFPLKDRKIQIKIKKVISEKGILYIMNGMPITDPEYCKKCVAMEQIEGLWELTKVNKTETQLRNTMKINVPVLLPKIILYPLIYKAPFKTFEELVAIYNNEL